MKMHMYVRYEKWVKLIEVAPWNEYEEEQFNVPKGHAVEHLISAILLFGAADNGRLNNAEGDHVSYVKRAVKRTRMHPGTMMNELEPVADAITAHRQIMAPERYLAQPS